MILDECKDLTDQIAKKRQLRIHVEQLKRYQKVRDLLATHADRLAPLVSVCQTLRDTSIGDVRLGDMPDRLLVSINDVRAKFQTVPESIIGDRSLSLNGLSQSVNVLAGELETEVKRAWVQYTAAKTPTTNHEVLDVLASAFPKPVARIRLLSEQLERDRVTLPVNALHVENFNRKAAVLQSAWEALGGEQVPEAVLQFLKNAASPQGAPLQLFTDEVRAWLVAHDILKSFKVRVGN